MSFGHPGEIPKIVWIMWYQGFDSAPELVRKCLRSWQRHNPNWQIVPLDANNYKEYINLDDVIRQHHHQIPIVHLSELVRINLLAKRGGVWVDASCFCCQPLDDWLGDYLASGFFAFEKPGKDRLISSWFLAAAENCHLAKTYCQAVNLYWSRHRFPLQNNRWLSRQLVKRIGKILNRHARSAALWVHPLTASVLMLRPYFCFHYIFYRVVAMDDDCGKTWRQTPKFSADIPHRLQFAGLLKPASAEIKTIVDGRKDPLYKLDWRCNPDLAPGCNLAYLLHSE
jgi:hypothetical protein